MNLSEVFDWYSHMAENPAWGDYVIDRARELAKDHPAVFGELPRMLCESNPALTQCSMQRSRETRANTFRIPAGYFPCREVRKK